MPGGVKAELTVFEEEPEGGDQAKGLGNEEGAATNDADGHEGFKGEVVGVVDVFAAVLQLDGIAEERVDEELVPGFGVKEIALAGLVEIGVVAELGDAFVEVELGQGSMDEDGNEDKGKEQGDSEQGFAAGGYDEHGGNGAQGGDDGAAGGAFEEEDGGGGYAGGGEEKAGEGELTGEEHGDGYDHGGDGHVPCPDGAKDGGGAEPAGEVFAAE